MQKSVASRFWDNQHFPGIHILPLSTWTLDDSLNTALDTKRQSSYAPFAHPTVFSEYVLCL